MSRPLVLIVGMLASKDCEGFLRNFSGLARRVIAIPTRHQEEGLPAGKLAECARSIGIPAQSRDTLAEALDAVGKFEIEPAPRILITGSLYLAGEVLAQNGTLPS